MKKYCHLSGKERFLIEKLYLAGSAIRRIAEFLSRSVNTISREIKKNSVKGIYSAEKSEQKTSMRRWRAKSQCLKVSRNAFLCVLVEQKFEKN